MLREGDKVYHYQNSNRDAVIIKLYKQQTKMMTLGGTTEQRLMAEIKYLDNQEHRVVYAGDLFKQFD